MIKMETGGFKMNVKITTCIMSILIMISLLPSVSMESITSFLLEDKTDKGEHSEWYSCGHFSRDLARNASEQNISMGSVILSNHPVFRGMWNSHIMNYFIINDSIWIIEPQEDHIMRLNDTMYNYYRLYPDGTQVPSYWKSNLAHTGVIY